MTVLERSVTLFREVLEAAGAFWIAAGFGVVTYELGKLYLQGGTGGFNTIRLLFSRDLSLALEFQLAADILATSIAPTWSEVGKLGATAVIRTGLNYFLSVDIQEERDLQEKRGTA